MIDPDQRRFSKSNYRKLRFEDVPRRGFCGKAKVSVIPFMYGFGFLPNHSRGMVRKSVTGLSYYGSRSDKTVTSGWIYVLLRIQFLVVELKITKCMILCLNSSPRRGATDYVLSKTQELLEDRGYESNIVNLSGKEIKFCRHCDYCLREKKCVIDDDMADINALLEKSEGIVFATPVYNSGITAQLKAVMDRTRALMAKNSEALLGKIGMGIAVGGDRMGGQEIALMQIHAFYVLNGVIPVSGGSFGANLGATFWSKDSREGVMEDEEGFKSLEKTINRFTQFMDEYGGEK